VAAQIVSAKIGQELHEQLLEKAAQENKSISEAVREAIQAWVEDKPKAGGEHGAEMKEQLQDMQLSVTMALQVVGEVMRAALKESGKAHKYAQLTTEYVIDMTSGLPKDSALGQQAKESKMRKLDEAVEQYSEELWDKTTAAE
jgi:Arc/MetJ-type ribon-helix-helix transcriptional regulator